MTRRSDESTRAYWWAVSIEADRCRDPEAHMVASLRRRGVSIRVANFAAQCVRWWCLEGQQFGALTREEPPPDHRDALDLADYVASKA
jgi:hypothetical protein